MTSEEAVIQVIDNARLDVHAARLDNIETGLNDLGDDLNRQHDDILTAIENLTR